MKIDSKEKNKNQRLQLMSSGAEDLEQWIFDLIRQGLAVLDGKPAIWQEMAARMVDAKMGGLAHRLRSMAQLKTDTWPAQVLDELGRLYLLTNGFKHFEKMPEVLKTQLQLVGGLTIRKNDLLLEPGLLDDWLVLGNWEGVNVDQAAYRKVWLQGKESQRMGLLIDYDYRGGGFEGVFKVGLPVKAEVVFYPGSYPLRLVIKNRFPPEYDGTQLLTFGHIEGMQKSYAEALAKNPWLIAFPAVIENLIPIHENGTFYLVDNNKSSIELETKDMAGWTLLSMSGGKPVVVFGEWKGHKLFPLCVLADGQFADLGKLNSEKAPNRFKRKFQ